jgi:ubiquitin conjugation factor E4 B
LSEVHLFLTDLGKRFPSKDDGLDLILVPLYRLLLFHPSLFRPEGFAGGDSDWRSVVGGVAVIAEHSKVFASVLGAAEDFLGGADGEISARELEMSTLLGPLARLGVFEREWPVIAKTYFENAQGKTRADVESSNAGLRATLNSLQVGVP